MISTGVRWDESNARKERGPLEVIARKKKDKLVLQRSDIYEDEPEENTQISLFDEEPGETMLMNDNTKKRLMKGAS